MAIPMGSSPVHAPSSKQPVGADASKTDGLGQNFTSLMVKGQGMSPTQAKNADTILGVGKAQNATTIALVASMYAAMGETSLGKDAGTYVPNSAGYWGVMQGDTGSWPNPHDVAGQALAFFTGHGPQGQTDFHTGAVNWVKQGLTNPAEIAIRTEVPSIWPDDAYAKEWPNGVTQGIQEAEAIVQAAGGGALASSISNTVSVVERYFYEINPHELYLDGMNRLAQEVNWELFFDGNRLYYDSEQALIKQKVAAVIHRDEDVVQDWDYDWDSRHICTQMTLTLFCDPFDLMQGEVIQLVGFGTASAGSTAHPDKLPGRWLIQDSQAVAGQLLTTFTLVQPDLPKLEPAPQVNQTTIQTDPATGLLTGLSGGTRDKIVSAAQQAIARQAQTHAYEYTENYDRAQASRLGLFAGAPVKLDCPGFAILCYKAAGAPDPAGLGYKYLGSTHLLEPLGTRVSLAQARPGDLVFYPGRVAVFLGSGQIAIMGSPGEPVQEGVLDPGTPTGVRSYL